MKMDFENKINEIKDKEEQDNLANTVRFSEMKGNSDNNLLHTFSHNLNDKDVFNNLFLIENRLTNLENRLDKKLDGISNYMVGSNKLFHEHDLKIEMQDNKITLISDNIDSMLEKLEAAYDSSQSKIKKSLDKFYESKMKPIFDNCYDKIGILNRKIDLIENKNNIKKIETNLVNNYQSNTSDHDNNNIVRSNSKSKLNSKQSSPNNNPKSNQQPKYFYTSNSPIEKPSVYYRNQRSKSPKTQYSSNPNNSFYNSNQNNNSKKQSSNLIDLNSNSRSGINIASNKPISVKRSMSPNNQGLKVNKSLTNNCSTSPNLKAKSR